MGLSVLHGACSFQHRLELCQGMALILGVRTFITEQCVQDQAQGTLTWVDGHTLPKPVACQAPGAPRASLALRWKWLQR